MSTTLITGGTVVNATGASAADVLVDGETIAAVLAPGSQLLGQDLAASVDLTLTGDVHEVTVADRRVVDVTVSR